MKRIVKMITLLFVLVLSFSLIGCNSTSVTNKEKTGTKVVKTTETAKIKPVNVSNKTESTHSVTQKVSNQVNKKTNIVTSQQAPTNVIVKKQPTTASKQTKDVVQKTSTPKTSTTTKSNQENTVTMSITGPKVYRGILSTSKITIKNGETILDVFLDAANKAGIDVDYSGSGATAYVHGISNDKKKYSFYEFDYGPKSGWLFKLNGVSLTKSSGLVKIKAGDRIECYYTE
jgi:uncharacterized lipoprotein YehR (DUF1307 family)